MNGMENNAAEIASGVEQASTVTESAIVGGMPVNQTTVVETPAVSVPNGAAQTPVEHGNVQQVETPVSTPEEIGAATERLKQQNARNMKAFTAMGIDPLSDIPEQLEHGLITPEMLQRHIQNKFGNVAPPAQAVPQAGPQNAVQ